MDSCSSEVREIDLVVLGELGRWSSCSGEEEQSGVLQQQGGSHDFSIGVEELLSSILSYSLIKALIVCVA